MTKPILVLQNIEPEGPGTTLDWLADRALPYTIVHTYREQALPDLAGVDAIICLGCPHSVVRYHEYDYLKALHTWVSRAVRESKPYLGICFGGQLLASVLGAKVEAGNAREIGAYRAVLTPEGAADPLFAGFAPEFPIFHWHSDTFRTPFNAVHLASDSVWKHQAYRKDRQVGLQFHLEVTGADVARWCERYADEMVSFGKTQEQVMAEFAEAETELRAANHRLLDNWLG